MEVLFDTVPMQTDVMTVTYDDPRACFSLSRSLFYLRRILRAGMPLESAEL